MYVPVLLMVRAASCKMCCNLILTSNQPQGELINGWGHSGDAHICFCKMLNQSFGSVEFQVHYLKNFFFWWGGWFLSFILNGRCQMSCFKLPLKKLSKNHALSLVICLHNFFIYLVKLSAWFINLHAWSINPRAWFSNPCRFPHQYFHRRTLQ